MVGIHEIGSLGPVFIGPIFSGANCLVVLPGSVFGRWRFLFLGLREQVQPPVAPVLVQPPTTVYQAPRVEAYRSRRERV